MRRLLFFLGLSICPIAFAFADEQRVSCDTTDGWTIIDPTGGAARPALTVGEPHEGVGSVQLLVHRSPGVAAAMACACLLTGLSRVEFDAWTERATTLLVPLEDRDGARFHVVRPLPAGTWTHFSFAMSDFGLAPDSPVKKPRVDPNRLGIGLGFLDAGGVLGQSGPNTLRIDALRIQRSDLPPATLPASLEDKLTIDAPGRLAGNLVLRAGAVLRVTAPRFVFAGDVRLEGGTLEIVGCAVSFEGAYPHQRKIELAAGSRVVLRDSILANTFLPSFRVLPEAALEFDGVKPVGASASTSVEGGMVTVRRTVAPGEFMIFPGSRLVFEDATLPMVWVALGANAKGTLHLPDGARIEEWTLEPALQIGLTLRRCNRVMWGLIGMPGADVTVADSRLYAAAITLWGKVELQGIRNGDAGVGARLALADRRIELRDSVVEVWNVYAGPGSHVTLRDCTLGECWSMGDAELTLESSVCDGKGGYVTSMDRSTFRLVNCTLDSEVIAQGSSTMTLEKCRPSKPVSASGKAVLHLRETHLPPGSQQLGDSRVVRDP